VVGFVGVVRGQDGGEGAEEGGRAGVESVVDVGGDDALEGGEVDGVEGRAEGDVGDGEEAGLGVEVEVTAVHGTVEGPDRAVGVTGFGWGPDVDGFGKDVRLEVGAQEVFGVDGEAEDDGGGDDGADGALRREGTGCHGGVFVLVLVASDAEAGALRGLAVAAVGFVGHAPEVVEDLLVAGDEVGRHMRLSVDLAECGNKEGASKYPVATLTIQKRRTQRVDLPRGPRRRKGAQGLGLERDAKI